MSEHEMDDLELAALRFVAGEMPAEEASGFEEQLAVDQRVREAVCRMVALTQKLVLDGSLKPAASLARARHETGAFGSRKVTRFAQPIGWITVGALAASLVFWFAGTSDMGPGDGLTQQRPEESKSPALDFDSNLVDTLAWLEMRDATRWNMHFEWPEQGLLVSQPLPAWDAPATIPDWILQTNGDME